MNKLKVIITILVILLSVSCAKTFDYSVYSAYVPKNYRDTRQQNLSKLSNKIKDTINNKKLCVALISDPHIAFDDLQESIFSINSDTAVDIIIVGGDMADGGMLEEFIIFRHIMEKAIVPYFTVIGNHDCLANGYTIYQEMFGPDDYTLHIANCKFVFFNDIVWELNNREPDFFWMFDEITNKNGAEHVFVVTHIPPFADSFSSLEQFAYTEMIDTAGVAISISGHLHHHYYGDYYGDGNMYMTIGSVDKKHWVKLMIDNDSINIERIAF